MIQRMKLLDYFKPVKQENNFNILPDALFTLEQDGKIIDINDKVLEMFNTSRYEFLGKYFSDCVENGTAVLNEIIKNKECVCAKAKLRETDTPIILELNAIRDKEFHKVYVSAREVTTRQRQQQNLNERYEMAQKIIDEKNDFLLTSSGALLSTLISK